MVVEEIKEVEKPLASFNFNANQTSRLGEKLGVKECTTCGYFFDTV